MTDHVPTVLIPGLMGTARLYAGQLAPLWGLGPIMLADHRGASSMQQLASGILRDAPPRFRLLGLSMGGYIAFEILRQAADRVTSLALLDTNARPDTPAHSAARAAQIAVAHERGMCAVADNMFPRLVHPERSSDAVLRATVREMAADTGAAAFERQQRAIMTRPDSRPTLAAVRCPTLVIVGEQDQMTPPALAREIAAAISDSHLVTIGGSGHLTALEQPDAVTSALLDFWTARDDDVRHA